MIGQALSWWLVVQFAGLVALPLALVVFQRLPGRGYAFAKPLGVILIGSLFWLALSLELLPNRAGSVVWASLPVAAASALILRRRREEILSALRERLGLIIAVEVLFAVVFAVGIFLRSHLPEIAGTEKPMDFMLLNAASRSRFYPPDDAWLAGFGVSYYYFGYVIQAMLGKLAGQPPAVTFNLALAGTAALAATSAFGLGYELVAMARRATLRACVVTGLAAALFVCVLGNLEGVLEFGIANDHVLPASIVESVDIANLEQAKESDSCLLGVGGSCIEYPSDASSFWWWWRATRISPDGNSITEFPFFSFLLGDLHPHVMALPFVLMSVALALSFWREPGPLDRDFWQRSPWLLLLSAVLVGGLGFLNTWDLPAFGFVLVVMVLARNLWWSLRLLDPEDTASPPDSSPEPVTNPLELNATTANAESLADGPAVATLTEATDSDWEAATREKVAPSRVWVAVSSTIGFVAPLAGLALLFYVPFYLSFSSQASGLAAVSNAATKPLHSFLFWAPLMAVALPLPLVLIGRDDDDAVIRRFAFVWLLPATLILAWVAVIGIDSGAGRIDDAVWARGANWLTASLYATALVISVTALWRTLESGAEEHAGLLVPVLVLTSTALLLIFGAELFYIKDVFGSRLNSVFKLYYQAWLMLSIAGAAGMYWLIREGRSAKEEAEETPSRRRPLRAVWLGATAVVLLAALLYPLGATLSRTNGLNRPNRTLDGLAFARNSAADEFQIAEWLRKRAGDGEGLMEAPGAQYSDGSRISAWSGVPAVIGWGGHETQWGRSASVLSQRQTDVDTAYRTPTLAEALSILRKYGITYVYVGNQERSKYPPEGLQKFESGMPVAHRSGSATIYRVPIVQVAPSAGQAR